MRPSMVGLFTLVFALGGWRAGLSRLSDNSFFWHLRTGRLILDHGIPHADPYSFTAPGRRWVAQSWLAEALYGVVDQAVGTFGLRLLTGLHRGGGGAPSPTASCHRLGRDRLTSVGLDPGRHRGVVHAVVGPAAVPRHPGLPRPPVDRRGPRLVARAAGRCWTIPVLVWLWANVPRHLLARAPLPGAPPGRPLAGGGAVLGRPGARCSAQAAVPRRGAGGRSTPTGPGCCCSRWSCSAGATSCKRVTEWRSPDFRTDPGPDVRRVAGGVRGLRGPRPAPAVARGTSS